MFKLYRNGLETVSLKELEEILRFRFLSSLEFQTPEIEKKVRKMAAKAIRKRQLTNEKWLGVNFRGELASGYVEDVSLRYIDENIGYGVFAEKTVPAGRFIAEYTGIVRKRRRRSDQTNNYCFEYAIGQLPRNPFIIDAKGQGNITRLINHSAEPNLESVSVFADGVLHIILVTIKSIKPGAQLCYDYGETFWKKRPKPCEAI